MKRIGRIVFCLTPLLLAVAIQYLVCIPAYGISAIVTVLKHANSGMSFSEIYTQIVSNWSASSFITWLSLLYAIVSLGVFGFWYWKKTAEKQKQKTAHSTFNLQIILALFLLAFGLQYVVAYLITFVSMIRPDWMRVYEYLINSVDLNKTISPVMAFYACIIAPISEELIFRGVTLTYAKKAMPAIAAVCLQAVLFGVFHMNMIQGIYTAFLGLFLGYVCLAGGSIVIPMLFHAFFNFCGTFLNSYMFYRVDQPFFFLFWLTAGVLFTYGGIFLFQHGIMVRNHSTTANIV